MRFSISASVLVLLGVASGLPTELEARVPSNAPINLHDGPDIWLIQGVKLNFPKGCPADDSRYEFPLMNGSPYDGGKNNVKQGDERVVFYYEDGEISYDGNP
ncbi:hypothetical protein CGCVW01_v012252 [Colletotrichum viniferum]|nr:hypothetical protein CGCVW01_v012252 [Colletotrichum viniferum]